MTKLLSKQYEALYVQFDDPSNSWNIGGFGGGQYEAISLSSNNVQVVANKGYFDLAGLSMEQKTLFINNISLQLQYPPTGTNGMPGDAFEMITMVSDVPISSVDIQAGAGWPLGTMSSDNCFLRRVQTWSITSDSGSFGSYFQLVNETVDGMAESTTSDRIYYASYVRLLIKRVGPVGTISTIDSVTIPGVRFVIQADAKEEPDFVYLMRQRRAYELQQEPDED
jgi:hypothetical protein